MVTDGKRRLRYGLGWAVIAFALLAGLANAHGIGEDAAGRSTIEYIPLGMEHMLLGWDHLVFIAGVLLLATGLKEAAKLISLFVLGHSITLIAATLAGWQLDATAVDVVIALSLVYVGVQGMAGKGYVETGPPYVIAAPNPEQDEAVSATTFETTLVCEEFDRTTVEEFSDAWISKLGTPETSG